MPSNLPWFATNGRIVDADGVLVCETSPEDAAAIVEAMAVWRAVRDIEAWLLMDSLRSLLVHKVRTNAVKAIVREAGGRLATDAEFSPLAAALIALAERVTR